MGVAASARNAAARYSEKQAVTLLELVTAVTEVTSDEREMLATVLHLLQSGRVELCGTFRDEPIDSWKL